MSTLSTKITNREIPVGIVYEDKQCLAFRGIYPRAPIHILIISKVPEAAREDRKLLGCPLLKAGGIAHNEGAADNFMPVINENAGRTGFHLHIHLMAGRTLGWPLG